MPCTPIFTVGPVNPKRQVDRSTGEQVLLIHNALHSYIYLSTCKPVLVHLSTCPSGLTDQDINKEVLGIMGKTLDLSTQGHRLTGRRVSKYGITYNILQRIFTPGQVDRSTGGQVRPTHNALHSYMCLSTCQPW